MSFTTGLPGCSIRNTYITLLISSLKDIFKLSKATKSTQKKKKIRYSRQLPNMALICMGLAISLAILAIVQIAWTQILVPPHFLYVGNNTNLLQDNLRELDLLAELDQRMINTINKSVPKLSELPRANIRCRFADILDEYGETTTTWNVFMSSEAIHYIEWCVNLVTEINVRCWNYANWGGWLPESLRGEVGMIVCNPEGRDRWIEKGNTAVFELRRSWWSRNATKWDEDMTGCVSNAVGASAPGILLDWRHSAGCYKTKLWTTDKLMV